MGSTKQTLAELNERRRETQPISPEAFRELRQEERLTHSYAVGEGNSDDDMRNPYNPDVTNLYALAAEDVLTIGHGLCKGWCGGCAMQLVNMRRTNTELNKSSSFDDKPEAVPIQLTKFVIGINDALGEGEEADRLRKGLFLPLIDSITVANSQDVPSAQASAFRVADYSNRRLLPEVLDAANLSKRAEVHSNLKEVTDIETAGASWHAGRVSRNAAWASGEAAEASRKAAGASWHAGRVSRNAAGASGEAAEASRKAAGASECAVRAIGAERVVELVMPTLEETIAINVDQNDPTAVAIASTNEGVAEYIGKLQAAA